MSLAAAVRASLPVEETPRCPQCAAALQASGSHRTGLWRAHHPGSNDCPLAPATWGHFPSRRELCAAIARGEGLRMAGPEALAIVANWIAAGLLVSKQKKREEG